MIISGCTLLFADHLLHPHQAVAPVTRIHCAVLDGQDDREKEYQLKEPESFFL